MPTNWFLSKRSRESSLPEDKQGQKHNNKNGNKMVKIIGLDADDDFTNQYLNQTDSEALRKFARAEQEAGNTGSSSQEMDETSSIQSIATTQSIAERAKAISRNELLAICSLVGMVLIGILASSLFMAVGINNAHEGQHADFEQSASKLIQEIYTAFLDYEMAGLWVHEETSRIIRSVGRDHISIVNNTSTDGFEASRRADFRRLYWDLVSSGLEFQVTSFNPNVTGWEERQILEADSRGYYAEYYPDLDYQGIVGLEPDPELGGMSVQPRSEQPFYFPVHLLEPVEGNEAAAEFDLYSSSSRRQTIHRALENYKPALTPRLHLVQEEDPSVYSVILMHPGTPSENYDGSTPASESFSSMVIRIPDLLKRASKLGEVSTTMTVHIFDTFSEHLEDPTLQDQFLGATRIERASDAEIATLTSLPEITLGELRATLEADKKLMVYEDEVSIVTQQSWLIVVTVSDIHTVDLTSIILAGVCLLILCIAVGLFLCMNFRRIHEQNVDKAQAARERADWMVETAKRAAQAERDLNDFIAHEVRNPLAAAISACSFVSSALESQALLPDSHGVDQKKPIQEDVGIIDSNLHFINDLLRNMLDIHRAHSKQLTIANKPIHLWNDVLRPVDSFLHRRGTSIKVELDCEPPNLMVSTDPLRLKQIISNLARNAIKFVHANEQNAVVRIRAYINNQGSVALCVEDTGPGIPPEKRAKLFGRFQESLDSLNQGTGIGLSLCKKLMDLMGGAIYLDEDYDSGIPGWPGTRFVVDLMHGPFVDDAADDDDTVEELHHDASGKFRPIHAVDASFKSLASATSGTTSHYSEDGLLDMEEGPPTISLPENLDVLFADDDTIVRKLFLRSLKRVAPTWNVYEAANGESALQLVQERQGKKMFDLIFLDQYMASVQKQLLGSETTLALRSRGVTCCICGLSANDVASAFEEAGADSFLFKPFPCQKEELKRELARILDSVRFRTRNGGGEV